MLAPTVPGATKLPLWPPITLGLVPLFSTFSTRWLFTLNSSGWLSVVPRKWVPEIVPLLPSAFQKVFEKLPS